MAEAGIKLNRGFFAQLTAIVSKSDFVLDMLKQIREIPPEQRHKK